MIRISKAFRLAALTLVFALTLLVAIQVRAQTSDQPASTQSITLRPIVVTGYLVPRVGGEGAQPVETLTRDFIDRQGDQTVADVIFRLPENVGSFSPLVFPGVSTTPSASAANLQGLGVDSTLVLIDGHRQTPFPFPLNGFQPFVDLNSIPLAAVDRIEILKDGASALYGSDAIAGVINVILKNEYQGADISSYYGISQRGDDEVWHVELTSGISHSFNENSKFSVVGAFDFYENSPIDAKDRSYSSNQNHTLRGPDFFDQRSLHGPAGDFIGLNSGNKYTVIPGSVGPFLNPANDFIVNGESNSFNNIIGTQLLPREQRIGGYLKAQYQLNQFVRFYDEFMVQRNKENASAAPVPVSETDNITVPANNPFNPFGEPLQWSAGRLLNLGPRQIVTEADNVRNVVGISLINLPKNWFVDASFLYAETDAEIQQSGSPLDSALNEALAGTLPGLEGQFYNPFPDSSVARKLNPNFTGPLQYTQDNHARTDLTVWEIRSGGELYDLPGGPITLGLGAEYRSDGYVNYKDINSQQGNVLGGSPSPNQSGKDYNRAVYGEFTVPILGGRWSWPGARLLEIVLAERYDNYSSFGGAWKPKISLRYKPLEDLTFRASYSEGFRAPSLPELFAQNTTFTFITDPSPPPGFPTNYEVERISKGNPNLQPETSYAYYAGLVWTPGHSDPEHGCLGWADGLTIYGDWTEILKRNVIDVVDPQFVVDNPQLFPGNVTRGAEGQIVSVLSPFENLGAIRVDSFSFGGSYSSKEYNWGKIDLAVDATYFYHVSQQNVPNGKVLNFTDTFTLPDFKLTSSIFYSKHLASGDRFQTGLTLNFIDSEHDINDFNTLGLTLQEFVAQFGLPEVHTVGNWTTLDWQISYEFGHPEEITPETTTQGYDKEDKKAGESKPVQIGPANSAWRNWVAGTKVTFGINNIFDTNPPFADTIQGYDTQVANPIGRFFYVQLEKKF
jgi:iron complex outermembrane receptor protein